MPAKNERIRESLQENDMTNYKGIYFGGDNEQAYYEGGAHFRYKDLCSKLEKIVLSLTPDRRGKSMYEDYTYSSVKGSKLLKIQKLVQLKGQNQKQGKS